MAKENHQYPADTLWAALMVILADEPERELLVIAEGF